MTDTPDWWWGEAEEKIGEVIIGFAEGLKTRLIKLGNKPMSLLGRKNPFLFRVRGKETVDSFCVEYGGRFAFFQRGNTVWRYF